MFKGQLLIFLFCLVFSGGFAQGKFAIENGKKSDRIKFELVNNLIIVPVEINGTELSFLVDTGVKTTVLLTLNEEDTTLLKAAEKIFLRGIGGEELIEAYRSDNNKFSLGKTTHPALSLYVINDPNINFSPRLGVPVHGIIGFDLFKDFVIEINYPRRYLRLHDPLQFSKKLRKYELEKLVFFQDKPYVEVELSIDGKASTATLLLDNGLSDAVWLFADGEQIKIPEKSFPDHLGMGLLGDVIGERSRLESMTIGKEVLQDISASFPDSLSVEGLRTYHARNGSIGAETLRRFHLFFDYANNNLFMKGNRWRNQPFSYNMSGIVLEHSGFNVVESYEEVVRSITSRNQNNNEVILEPAFYKKFELKPAFTIARLRNNSPALLAGLQVGDEVLKINGRSAWKLDLDDFTRIFSSEEGKKVKMEVLRKGKRFNYDFELKSPLQ